MADFVEMRDEDKTKDQLINELVELRQRVRKLEAQYELVKEALQESEGKWRFLMDNAPNIVMILDRDGIILFVNHSMPGVTRDEAIGMSVYDYVPPEHRDGLRKSLERVFQTGEVGGTEIAWVGPQGAASWCVVHIGPIRYRDRVVAAVAITADITERVRAEEEREELIRELQDALAKIKKLSGLLPICASCKKIRDDKGYWRQVEEYISEHSEAEFSHSLCPECAKKLYPDFYEGDDK